MFFVSF